MHVIRIFLTQACLTCVVISCAYTQTITSAHLSLQINDSLYTRANAGFPGATPIMKGFFNSEYLDTKFFTTTAFKKTGVTKKNIRDSAGPGYEWVITGRDMRHGLEKILSVKVYDSFPDAVYLHTAYINRGSHELTINKWINAQYEILPSSTDTTRFWSFQGSSHVDRRDWIMPVNPGFSEKNYMGMNSSDYGGGIPVIDLWRRDAGIAIGSTEKSPTLIALPVDYDKFRKTARIGIIQAQDEPTILRVNDTLTTAGVFISVHQKDCFATLRTYGKYMTTQGIRAADPSPLAFEPMWCAWGYGTKFTVKQILTILPKVKSLGFTWVGLDDGFQMNNGDWIPNKEHFPRGEEDMKALVDSIHAYGLKAMIWWAPLAVDTRSEFYKLHPGSVLMRKDGSPQYISYWDDYYMAPTDSIVLRETETVVKRFIGSWGFDGLKLDGQHMNACAPDYGAGHGIDEPAQSFEKMPAVFQLIYKTAKSIKPESVVEFCPCGDVIDLYHMPYTNQFVSSDPLSSRQVRLKGKVFKALMPGTAYFGDHVELTDDKKDFASQLGVGAIPGTKFTWPATRDKSVDENLLTPEKEILFKKFMNIFQATRLSEGAYQGALYDYGYDYPETHVISKNGKMYYAFYAPAFSGSISLRGLDAGKSYQVNDYFNNRDLGTVKGAAPSLTTAFKNFLLLEVSVQ